MGSAIKCLKKWSGDEKKLNHEPLFGTSDHKGALSDYLGSRKGKAVTDNVNEISTSTHPWSSAVDFVDRRVTLRDGALFNERVREIHWTKDGDGWCESWVSRENSKTVTKCQTSLLWRSRKLYSPFFPASITGLYEIIRWERSVLLNSSYRGPREIGGDSIICFMSLRNSSMSFTFANFENNVLPILREVSEILAASLEFQARASVWSWTFESAPSISSFLSRLGRRHSTSSSCTGEMWRERSNDFGVTNSDA